jgi:AcrR family transcriptional regulator
MTERKSTPQRSGRSQRAAATKAAILASARRAFAELGYDGAGVRGIAEGAGVTAMMVNRYFGSKEQLFAEVVAASMADPVILSAENLASPTLCRDLAKALVGLTGPDETPLDGFLILFRSVSSPTAARIAREQIAAIHQRTAQGAVRGGEHAAQRAGLFLAVVAGVQMMRQMIGLSALADADPETLVDLLTPIFEQILCALDEAGTPHS